MATRTAALLSHRAKPCGHAVKAGSVSLRSHEPRRRRIQL